MDNYDGDVTDMVKVKLTHPSGFSETVSSLDPETVRVDTHKHGTWMIDVKARDLASAFGKNYMDNVASIKGVVVVANGQITQIKFAPKHQLLRLAAGTSDGHFLLYQPES